MLNLRKVLSKIYVFEPYKDGYRVYPEGRELCYEGDKLVILYKMTKKFPTMKNVMAYLMDKEVPFFYNPLLRDFRVYKKGLSKEKRNEVIGEFYRKFSPMLDNNGKVMVINGNMLDNSEDKKYISLYGLNEKNINDSFFTNEIQSFIETP